MKEVKFLNDFSALRLGVIKITRKATKDGRPIGPIAGVSVIVPVEPRTMDQAEAIAAEFAADWKGSVAKYGVSVDVN
jgi:hypothetical protein